jgi:hypothetical protein
MSIDLIILSIPIGYILLINLFVAVMHTKAVIDRGETIHPLILYPLYLGTAVALVLDVLFNVLCGTWIFKELPREFTFTSRCSRHKSGTAGRRKNKAKWWCSQLNKFDKGHC